MATSMKHMIGKAAELLINPVRACSGFALRSANALDAKRFLRFDFVVQPGDIFLATYPRSGTTWLQMIFYQLCTDGEMDFVHISERCPFLERIALDPGRRHRLLVSDAMSRTEQRIFKTHLPYRAVPKGDGKYIYLYRDGMDVAISLFHFHRTHLRFQGDFDKFFDRIFMAKNTSSGSWFEHASGWMAANDPRVLIHTFEELKRDPEGGCIKMARFCNLPLAKDRLHRVLERCSIAFMKEHEDKFDPIHEQLWEKGIKTHSFIRTGEAGAGVSLFTPDQRSRYLGELEKWPRLKDGDQV